MSNALFRKHSCVGHGKVMEYAYARYLAVCLKKIIPLQCNHSLFGIYIDLAVVGKQEDEF